MARCLASPLRSGWRGGRTRGIRIGDISKGGKEGRRQGRSEGWRQANEMGFMWWVTWQRREKGDFKGLSCHSLLDTQLRFSQSLRAREITHTHTHSRKHTHSTDGRRAGQSRVACSCITLCEWRWVLTLQPAHANVAVNTNTLTG